MVAASIRVMAVARVRTLFSPLVWMCFVWWLWTTPPLEGISETAVRLYTRSPKVGSSCWVT